MRRSAGDICGEIRARRFARDDDPRREVQPPLFRPVHRVVERGDHVRKMRRMSDVDAVAVADVEHGEALLRPMFAIVAARRAQPRDPASAVDVDEHGARRAYPSLAVDVELLKFLLSVWNPLTRLDVFVPLVEQRIEAIFHRVEPRLGEFELGLVRKHISSPMPRFRRAFSPSCLSLLSNRARRRPRRPMRPCRGTRRVCCPLSPRSSRCRPSG